MLLLLNITPVKILSSLQSVVPGRMFLLILLSCSFLGYYLLLRFLNLRPPLIPGTVICFIILSEYFGGLLNLLPLCTILLLAAGLVLFTVFCLYPVLQDDSGKFFLRSRIFQNRGCRTFFLIILFMALSCTYFFLVLHDSVINGYDDFSHWALIVKSMLANNRLPRASESYITFSSYPPGSASFIYYFCRIAGNREGYYLFAQFFMKLSFLCALYSVPAAPPATFLVTIVLAMHNVSSHTLSVDNLLSCCGLFCLFCALSFVSPKQTAKKSAVGKNGFRTVGTTYILFAMAASACILIKNSGIFFYLFTLTFILLKDCLPGPAAGSAPGNQRFRKGTTFRFAAKALLCAFPLIVLFLWQRHVAHAFPDGLQAKHTMSLAHYLEVLSGKTPDDLHREAVIILSRILHPQDNHLLPLLAAFLIAFLLFRKTVNKMFRLIFVLVILFALLYQAGILGMYLCSMPHEEILIQNGTDYYRYNGTMVTFYAGIFYAFLFHARSGIQRQEKSPAVPGCGNRTGTASSFRGPASVVCLVLVLAALYPRLHFSDLNPTLKCYAHYSDKVSLIADARSISGQFPESFPTTEDGYVFVRVGPGSDENGYIKYMTRYLLLHNKCQVFELEDEKVFQRRWKKSSCTYCIDLVEKRYLRK